MPRKRKIPTLSAQLGSIQRRLDLADDELGDIQALMASIRELPENDRFWIKQHFLMARAALNYLVGGIEKVRYAKSCFTAALVASHAAEHNLRSVALRLMISEQTLRKWIKDGKLRAEHRGLGRGYYVVTEQELLRVQEHLSIPKPRLQVSGVVA